MNHSGTEKFFFPFFCVSVVNRFKISSSLCLCASVVNPKLPGFFAALRMTGVLFAES
jgi:hypothetical protein